MYQPGDSVQVTDWKSVRLNRDTSEIAQIVRVETLQNAIQNIDIHMAASEKYDTATVSVVKELLNELTHATLR